MDSPKPHDAPGTPVSARLRKRKERPAESRTPLKTEPGPKRARKLSLSAQPLRRSSMGQGLNRRRLSFVAKPLAGGGVLTGPQQMKTSSTPRKHLSARKHSPTFKSMILEKSGLLLSPASKSGCSRTMSPLVTPKTGVNRAASGTRGPVMVFPPAAQPSENTPSSVAPTVPKNTPLPNTPASVAPTVPRNTPLPGPGAGTPQNTPVTAHKRASQIWGGKPHSSISGTPQVKFEAPAPKNTPSTKAVVTSTEIVVEAPERSRPTFDLVSARPVDVDPEPPKLEIGSSQAFDNLPVQKIPELQIWRPEATLDYPPERPNLEIGTAQVTFDYLTCETQRPSSATGNQISAEGGSAAARISQLEAMLAEAKAEIKKQQGLRKKAEGKAVGAWRLKGQAELAGSRKEAQILAQSMKNVQEAEERARNSAATTTRLMTRCSKVEAELRVLTAQYNTKKLEVRALRAEALAARPTLSWSRPQKHFFPPSSGSTALGFSAAVSSLTVAPGTAVVKTGEQYSWLRCNAWHFDDNVLGRILGFLDDDQLFETRCLSKLTYGVYLGQEVTGQNCRKVKFNIKRALWLSYKGRRFSNVEHLDLPSLVMTADRLQSLSPAGFPALRGVFFGMNCLPRGGASIKLLPPHPNLETMHLCLPHYTEVEYLGPDRYPNLQSLNLGLESSLHHLEFIPDEGFPELKTLRLAIRMRPDDWGIVNAINFPKLKTVQIRKDNLVGGDKVMLEQSARLCREGMTLIVK